MMVRVFLHEFAEFVSAHADGMPYPAEHGDADRQLESFLERLAVDASQIDDAAARAETEAEIRRGLARHLSELLRHAAWNRNSMHWN
jgi:hypothetical protein